MHMKSLSIAKIKFWRLVRKRDSYVYSEQSYFNVGVFRTLRKPQVLA
jgi:hypothetical protein